MLQLEQRLQGRAAGLSGIRLNVAPLSWRAQPNADDVERLNIPAQAIAGRTPSKRQLAPAELAFASVSNWPNRNIQSVDIRKSGFGCRTDRSPASSSPTDFFDPWPRVRLAWIFREQTVGGPDSSCVVRGI
jgi:hypothetical protein